MAALLHPFGRAICCLASGLLGEQIDRRTREAIAAIDAQPDDGAGARITLTLDIEWRDGRLAMMPGSALAVSGDLNVCLPVLSAFAAAAS